MPLNNKTKFKLILGLGNKDIKSALEVALLYAKAGVRFFDASPEILPELSKGLIKLGFNRDDFTLCASAPILGDIHGRKAFISESICSGCSLCMKNCPEDAVYKNKKSGKYEIDSKKCIGCSACKKITNCYAISFEYSNGEINSLKKLIDEGFKIDMAELHASISDKKQIIKDFKDILTFFRGDISVCINRRQFPLDDTVKLLKELKRLHSVSNAQNSDNSSEFYVQADGASMNGGDSSDDSTLECVLFAKELAPYGFNLIVSGGTNNNTPKILNDIMSEDDEYNMPVIAYGTYARKLVSGLPPKEALIKAKVLFEETENYDRYDRRDSTVSIG